MQISEVGRIGGVLREYGGSFPDALIRNEFRGGVCSDGEARDVIGGEV